MNKVEVRRPCGGWKTEGIFSFFNFKRRTCHITFKGEHDLMVCFTLEPRCPEGFYFRWWNREHRGNKLSFKTQTILASETRSYRGSVFTGSIWDYFELKKLDWSRVIYFMDLTSGQFWPVPFCYSVAQNYTPVIC